MYQLNYNTLVDGKYPAKVEGRNMKVTLQYDDNQGIPEEDFYFPSGDNLLISFQDPNDPHMNGSCKTCWLRGYRDPFLGGYAMPCGLSRDFHIDQLHIITHFEI